MAKPRQSTVNKYLLALEDVHFESTELNPQSLKKTLSQHSINGHTSTVMKHMGIVAEENGKIVWLRTSKPTKDLAKDLIKNLNDYSKGSFQKPDKAAIIDRLEEIESITEEVAAVASEKLAKQIKTGTPNYMDPFGNSRQKKWEEVVEEANKKFYEGSQRYKEKEVEILTPIEVIDRMIEKQANRLMDLENEIKFLVRHIEEIRKMKDDI
jgi:hypothetical protein